MILHHRLILLASLILGAVATSTAIGGDEPKKLTLIDRCVTQDQGAWIIDYRLKYYGGTGVVVLPDEIAVRIEGWVSNSRIESHAIPKQSLLKIDHRADLSDVSEIISAPDDSHRCSERLLALVWTEDQNRATRHPSQRTSPSPSIGVVPIAQAVQARSLLPLSIAPDGIVHIQLRLEHQHAIYGDYDPLLSMRTVELKLGSLVVHDIVPLDCEQYLALPRFTWPDPPVERRDTLHFISAPDSLHIEAHVAGNQCYRYPERPIRYNTKMRYNSGIWSQWAPRESAASALANTRKHARSGGNFQTGALTRF